MSDVGPSRPLSYKDLTFRGEAEVDRAAEFAASVENDPEPDFGTETQATLHTLNERKKVLLQTDIIIPRTSRGKMNAGRSRTS